MYVQLRVLGICMTYMSHAESSRNLLSSNWTSLFYVCIVFYPRYLKIDMFKVLGDN